MSPANEPTPVERISMGPVKVVEVFTSPVPAGKTVAEALGNETVPFEQIRHLCSCKPLGRPVQTEPDTPTPGR
jgi:hypothetical protein